MMRLKKTTAYFRKAKEYIISLQSELINALLVKPTLSILLPWVQNQALLCFQFKEQGGSACIDDGQKKL